MQPFSEILDDLRPESILELGRDPDGASLTAAPAFADVHIIDMPDRDRWARQPEELAFELERLESPLELVIDHATEDVDVTLGFIEVLFGRLAPDGRYVVDGSPPSDVVLRLMLATVASPELIHKVMMTTSTLVLQRGRRDRSPDRVRLADLYADPLGLIE